MRKEVYHPEWQNARIEFIINQLGTNFFNNKTVLELGAYNGYIGNYISKLGANVTSVEGRQENVDYILMKYPHLKPICADLDVTNWQFGKYDIIINFGLFYHLQNNHKEHLINCINNCNTMFFETVVFDSFDSEINYRNEQGDDQSLSTIGGTPSTSYVEHIFKKLNVNFTKYTDWRLNAGPGPYSFHHYDWKDTNSKILDPFARRMWIVNNK